MAPQSSTMNDLNRDNRLRSTSMAPIPNRAAAGTGGNGDENSFNSAATASPSAPSSSKLATSSAVDDGNGHSSYNNGTQDDWTRVLLEIQRSQNYGLLLLPFADQTSTPLTPYHWRGERGEMDDEDTNITESSSAEMSSPRSDETVTPSRMLRDARVGMATIETEPEPNSRDAKHSMDEDEIGELDEQSGPEPVAQLRVRDDTSTASAAAGTNTSSTPRSDTTIKSKIAEGADAHSLPSIPVDLPDSSSLSKKCSCILQHALEHSDVTAPLSQPSSVARPQTALHQRRVSAVPVKPSPLGPGHYTSDLGSDGSGLVAQSPPGTAPLVQTTSLPRSRPVSAPKTATIATTGPWSSSLNVTAVSNSTKNAQRTGLAGPKLYATTVDDANDPFTEHGQASRGDHDTSWEQNTTLPYCRLPNFEQHLRMLRDTPSSRTQPMMHTTQHLVPPVPSMARSGSTQPIQQASAPIQSRHEAEKAKREEWIRKGACRIALVGRFVQLARQEYERTQTQSDYNVLKQAEAMLREATDLDKLQEERRNLLLPQGMRALRTGPYCLPGDAIAGNLGGRENGTGGNGQLLGFRMAIMERICAEVKRDTEGKAQGRQV